MYDIDQQATAHALTALGITSEPLFIDDLDVNVDAAKRIDIKAALYKKDEDLKNLLHHYIQ